MRKQIYTFAVGLFLSLQTYGQNWVYMFNSVYGETPTTAEKSVDVGITDPLRNPDYRDLEIGGFIPRKFKTPYLLDKETGVGVSIGVGESVEQAKSRYDSALSLQAPEKKAKKNREEKARYKKTSDKELLYMLIEEVYGVDRGSL